MPRYLADTSIWAWAAKGKRRDITERLAERVRQGAVVTCHAVVLETMHRARNGREYDAISTALFGSLTWIPMTSTAADRAVDVQRELAHGTHGNHLRPAIDHLIAAAAEEANVILWALDKDLAIIAAATGQPFEGEQAPAP